MGKRRDLIAWAMILPALLLNVFVMGGPILGTLTISMTNWDGIRPPRFIGLANFKRLLGDGNFLWAVLNNMRWMIFFVTIPIIFALIVAVLLSKVNRGQMLYRTLYFLPYIVTSVVTAKIWSLIFNPFVGIGKVMERFGTSDPPLFLADPDIALFSVAFVDASRYWVFLMVMFLTAFFQLDKSLEEAGTIDGANRFQNFIHIMLPQIRPTLSTILILTFIWSFTSFDFVYLMTGGGPGNATELISTYMYRLALRSQQPGYASAISLVMVLFSASFLFLIGMLRKRGWEI